MTKRYCIIGASAAGVAAALKIRELDPQGIITCFSAEQEIPYNKCFLADYVAGSKQESQLTILSPATAAEKNINFLPDCRIEHIDQEKNMIVDQQNRSYVFDELLLATGTTPFMPASCFSGSGIFFFHTKHHSDQLLAFITLHNVTKAVVIGGGVTGVELADALHTRNIQVTIVERAPYLLAFMSEAASTYVQEKIIQAGAPVYTSASVTAVEREQDVLKGVQLSSGEFLEADVIIYAIGQRPNNDLARSAGLALHNNYLLVDEYQRTSNPRICAAGDCVMVRRWDTNELVPTTTWPDAMQQGITAAYTMTGNLRPYRGVIPLISSSFFGMSYLVGGTWCNTQDMQRQVAASYYEEYVQDDTLRYFVFVGTMPERMRALRIAYMTKQILKGV